MSIPLPSVSPAKFAESFCNKKCTPKKAPLSVNTFSPSNSVCVKFLRVSRKKSLEERLATSGKSREIGTCLDSALKQYAEDRYKQEIGIESSLFIPIQSVVSDEIKKAFDMFLTRLGISYSQLVGTQFLLMSLEKTGYSDIVFEDSTRVVIVDIKYANTTSDKRDYIFNSVKIDGKQYGITRPLKQALQLMTYRRMCQQSLFVNKEIKIYSFVVYNDATEWYDCDTIIDERIYNIFVEMSLEEKPPKRIKL